MAGTADTAAPYEWAAVFPYQNWGSDERYLVSFINAGHSFGYIPSTPADQAIIDHFATAFLGYYLNGNEDYAQYMTEDFVSGVDGLVWGAYEP